MNPSDLYDEFSSSDDGADSNSVSSLESSGTGNALEEPAIMDTEGLTGANSLANVEEDTNTEESEPCTFDRGLPCQHSYLGNDLEVLSGRTLLDDGSFHKLDLMYPNGVVLVPGQTLPLTVFEPRTINMLQECIAKDRTFGVIYRWISEKHLQDIGTTAEIYEYQSEAGLDGFRIKAKGRQRFKVIKSQNNNNGRNAMVRILPEIRLPDSLSDVRFQSLNRHRSSQPIRCRKRDAMVTSWPEWVYRQYDTKRLISNIKEQLTFLEEGQQQNICWVPEDPTELSFWLAYNLPISEEQVIFLLQLNSPIQRLRWEFSVLQKLQILCCNRCLNHVGSHKDVFSMSVEGPQGTYVNPGGYVHETLTLYKVKYIYDFGVPSTEFSWFPGYAWTIAKCQHCYLHMGWRFTATNKKLRPKEFWGLCRGSLVVQFNNDVCDDVNDQAGLIL